MTVAIHNLTDTWNNAGTTFTAIKMNVTDTTSAAASLLMDLQVGGSSMMSVTKGGAVRGPVGSVTEPTFSFGAQTNTGIYRRVASTVSIACAGNSRFEVASDVSIGGGRLAFSSGALQSVAVDTFLCRDAANVLAQRNGTTAQEHRWWKTFTDAANGEYGSASWMEEANVFEIGTKALGTGTQRDISITAGSAKIRMPDLPTSNPAVAGALWNNAGVLNVSAG